MPEALRARACVPSGLSGPGPMVSGIDVDQLLWGLCHVGLVCLLTTENVPVGVGNSGRPVATS